MAKIGRLGNDHKDFIQQNAGKMSDAEIAKYIGKTEERVKKFRVEELGIGEDLSMDKATEAQIRSNLHSKKYWPEIRKQLVDDNEIEYFENKWVGYVKQFQSDVLETERSAIEQMIKFEIMNNRLHKKLTELEIDIGNYNKIIGSEKQKNKPNMAKVEECLGNKMAIQATMDQISDDIRKNQQRIDKLNESLKATRKDRITRLENANKGVMGLLAKLMDPDFRDEEGTEIELVRRAVEKEKRRLSEYHEYMDGEVCQPMISTQAIKEDNT